MAPVADPRGPLPRAAKGDAEGRAVRVSIEFDVVPADERPAGVPKNRRPSPLSVALERGDTVFVPGRKSGNLGSVQQKRSYLRSRGFAVVAREGERNGVKGVYVWAERNGQNGHES
jgi:hypothetical protein